MLNRGPDDLDAPLAGFIEEVAGADSIRIEEDFGQGFVKLRSSEAERRQAAQDIRSCEDAVIELLRNSRDAGAKNIFVATGKAGEVRTIVTIDDGVGIPSGMRERIFQPRVTSKLDSAHMDKWGLHGRGMALYSIAENSLEHSVVYSSVDNGSSIKVVFSMNDVSEKKDQSSFPEFEISDGTFMIRGPKNIQRVICEFAIENRKDVNVFLGSSTEIAATLYSIGLKTIPAKERIFSKSDPHEGPAEMISYANDPSTFSDIAAKLGLVISTRSSRRIMDGEIKPLCSIFSQIEHVLYTGPDKDPSSRKIQRPPLYESYSGPFSPKMTRTDLKDFQEKVNDAFKELADKYYLAAQEAKVSLKNGKLVAEIELKASDD